MEDGIDRMRNQLEIYRDYAEGGKEKANYYIVDGYLDAEDPKGREDDEGKDYRLFGTHEEFDKYKYPKQQDGKVIRKIPVPLFDHGLDCSRYAVHTAYSIIMDLVIPLEDTIEGGYWGRQQDR